jgi:ParB-like chromosome segregation protein Spo0J
MITSEKTQWNAAISDETQPLTPSHFGYFQGRLRNNLFIATLSLFLEKKKSGFTRADLARRLGKKPEQVTRWLAGPGNIKIDTLSDLLLAMGHELEVNVRPIETRLKTNLKSAASIKSNKVSFRAQQAVASSVKGSIRVVPS